MTPLVIYHGHCRDGFCSAWVASRFLEDAEFFAADYGDPPPMDRIEGSPRDVYVLDFSYPRAELIEIAKRAKSLVLLDHHRTAQQDLQSLQSEMARICAIPLPDGSVAYIDKEDAVNIRPYSWSKSGHGGAMAYAGGGRENPKSVYMHRLIMGAEEGMLVDHVNRNPLDNRRANLRHATKQQNAANMDRGSKFKGVTESRGKLRAQITVDGQNRYLGTFDTPEDAARAYDSAAREAFGQYALLNFGSTIDLVPPNMTIVFDMERSGAGITWDWFRAEPRWRELDSERPWLVNYVEDRDLWRFKLQESEAVNAYVSTLPFEFAAWNEASEIWPDQAIKWGDICLAKTRQYIREVLAANAQLVEFDGETVPLVNAPQVDISELVRELLDQTDDAPFALGFWQRGDGKFAYSLRSNEGFDVSEVAKRYGGGGHAQAAGFQADEILHRHVRRATLESQ